MRIWNGLGAYPDDAPEVVASIGNYDGVHIGHQAILRRAVEDARRRRLASLLVTFDPHPVTVLAPERKPRLLQTRGQKLESLQQAGLHDVLILEFDRDLAELSGEQFFDQLLNGRVDFAAIHVGENFRFGHRREGDLELLQRIGARRNFEVRGVRTLEIEGRTVSSSNIRARLDAGEVEWVRRMLGRPFCVVGEVVRGDGRGRELQSPTANLELQNEMLPSRGVYITETVVLASRMPSVTNVGVRPTFGGETLTVETHVLDLDEDLYDERLEVHFLARLRDEMRFGSASELADQLARDRAAAEAYFHNQRFGTP